ncbi:hypothetical protein FPT19_00940 [Erysipelothrix rhusiopathiae]|uniref:hypothetical protein n=1 Tax=Erysipelothrix rhusiopathiae TaxID=1648 RepID=UPI000CA1F807|nr:hypothetical protein [Erysipelothrix rhusiopathiae]ASD51074.1 hypothetical protein SER90K_17 [Erysipelothrix phage phi1605]QDS38423.1 hypothetical protein FPT19_00940 [Erysipelothrix rhusiopathiae]
MNFVEFVTITRPILGGKGGVHIYVRTLFDAILTENGKEILDGYSKESYKAYAGGKTSIRDISKTMVQYVDPVEFSSFIFNTEESAQIALCEQFTEFLPNINVNNVGDEIAELFANIIRTAAQTKRKKPASKKDTGTGSIELPDEQHSDESPYSSEDNGLLQEFTSDYDEIMFTMIGENYSTALIDMSLPNKVQALYKTKWSTKADTFNNPTLKSYVFSLLGELNQLSNCLLTDGTEPFFIKQTRTRIRNLYVKLHPDLFSGAFPYDAFIDDWDDGEFY